MATGLAPPRGLPSPGAHRKVRILFSPTMTLSPEQRSAVAQWVAAGDSLAAIQRKLTEELKLSMTYMEVRFLVDDLGLELKSPAPAKPVAQPQPAAPAEPPAKKGLFGKLKDAVTGGSDEAAEAELPPEDAPLDVVPGQETVRGLEALPPKLRAALRDARLI